MLFPSEFHEWLADSTDTNYGQVISQALDDRIEVKREETYDSNCIHRIRSIPRAAEAHRHAEKGGKTGNVVITVGHNGTNSSIRHDDLEVDKQKGATL
jgi:hypothetical protein